jgi:hypothetical protein
VQLESKLREESIPRVSESAFKTRYAQLLEMIKERESAYVTLARAPAT